MHLSPSLYLGDQIVDADQSDAVQKRFGFRWVFEQPSFRFGKSFASSTFNHISHQSPRGTAEPNQGNLACKLLSRKRYRFKDIVQLFVDVHVDGQPIEVRGIFQRIRNDWSFPRVHDDFYSHGLGHNQNIGEDDGSVHKTSVSPDWLQRHFTGQLRSPTKLKKFMILSDLPELCTSMRFKTLLSSLFTNLVGIAQPGA